MSGKAIGILMLVLVSAIVFPMVMGVSLSSNTTGWQPIMIQATQNYLPLLALVVVIVAVIGGLVIKSRA
jgi:hypothetical protein